VTTPAAAVAPPSRNADRIVSAEAAEVLARFDDPALLADGKVVVISLDAIVERFGGKWPLRSDQVHEHVDRTLERVIGRDGYFLRVSATDYLVCQPEVGRFIGQANCLRSLREVLGHFLGAAHLADGGLRQVFKLGRQGIEAHQLDARAIEIGAAQTLHGGNGGEGEAPTAGNPFAAADGRMLRVSCALEPLFELKGFGRIGMRLSRRICVHGSDEPLTQKDVANLTRTDVLRADLATIARGVDRLRSDAGRAHLPTLIVPLSYISLSGQRGREDIIRAFNDAASLVERGLICELSNIEGAPASSLQAVVGLIRPHAVFVVGRLTAPQRTSSALKEAGLHGLSFEVSSGLGEGEFLPLVAASVEAVRRVSRTVLVYGATTPREVGAIAAMGATHASVRGS